MLKALVYGPLVREFDGEKLTKLFEIEGLVGGALVETPVVEDGKITGFHVYYGPWRTFPTDMAGFAVNLDFIKNTTFVFAYNFN